jgi:hypothetical protein
LTGSLYCIVLYCIVLYCIVLFILVDNNIRMADISSMYISAHPILYYAWRISSMCIYRHSGYHRQCVYMCIDNNTQHAVQAHLLHIWAMHICPKTEVLFPIYNEYHIWTEGQVYGPREKHTCQTNYTLRKKIK